MALIILGLLLVWLVPIQMTWAGQQIRARPWRALLNGLLVFVFGWIVALLAIVVVVVFAIFLYWVSLPDLAFLFGMIGLMTVGLAVSLFWLCIAFFSKLVVIDLVATMLFKRFLPKAAGSRVWPLLVGVLLYALLVSIPYLGFLIAVVTTLIGLGSIWMVASMGRQAKNLPASVEQPTGESLDTSPLPEG